MIDFEVFIKTVLLFTGLIFLAPLFLSFSQSINILIRTHRFPLSIKSHYQMAIKELLFGFPRDGDMGSSFCFWIELAIMASILLIMQIAEAKNTLLIVTIFIIILNVFPLFKIFLSKGKKGIFFEHSVFIRLGGVIFLALANYMSLLMAYKKVNISDIVQAQAQVFSFGPSKMGIFLNPLNAFLFLTLIVWSVNYLVPEEKAHAYEQNGQIFIEQCLWSLKLILLSVVFTWLFLGGFKEFSFLSAIIDKYPQTQIPIQIGLGAIKIFFVLCLLSFINYFLIPLEGKAMEEIIVIWFIPLGFLSILYSWMGSFYFV